MRAYGFIWSAPLSLREIIQPFGLITDDARQFRGLPSNAAAAFDHPGRSKREGPSSIQVLSEVLQLFVRIGLIRADFLACLTLHFFWYNDAIETEQHAASVHIRRHGRVVRVSFLGQALEGAELV